MANTSSIYIDLLHGQEVTVAVLNTISLAELRSGDNSTTEALHEAASGSGFFYLNLRDDPRGSNILAGLAPLYQLSDRYFSQAEHKKREDVRSDIEPSQDLGYKASDCDETYEISWNEITHVGPSSLPKLLQEEGSILQEFMTHCQDTSILMLNAFNPAWVDLHRDDHPSDTGLKFISEPSLDKRSEVGDWTHTDSGTLTMLFYDAWGLETYLEAVDQWAWIPPQDGCVVVNVADSLQKLSKGRLHSPKHRVAQPTDGSHKRYYLSYFLRPESVVKKLWLAASS